MLAERLIIKEGQKVVIYGAGLKGEMFYEIAKKNKLKVIAFFDKNASAISMRHDTIVINPYEDIQLEYIKDEVLIIISVNDIFVHEDIARSLYNLGFRNILYKPNILKKLNRQEKKMSDCFDSFYLDYEIIGSSIPIFSPSPREKCKDNSIIAEQENHYITYLPAERLFALSEDEFVKKYGSVFDEMNNISNCIYYIYCGDLFYGFETGLERKQWNNFLKTYLEGSYNYLNKGNDEAILIHLKNRYKIFQKMSNAFHINPLFFEYSPIMILENSQGKLVIKDGSNRAAFMLSKKMFWFPCRIEKRVFEKIYNGKILITLKRKIAELGIYELPLPISHPYFRNFTISYDIYSKMILRDMCYYMRQEKKVLYSTTFLDVNAYNGFYSQFFENTGCYVTAIEKNKKFREVFNIVNKLLNCNNIDLVEKISDSKKFDFAFIHSLLSSKNINFEEIKFVIALSKIVFIEIEDDYLEKLYDTVEGHICKIISSYVVEEKLMKIIVVKSNE